jgi:hypothetical protein
MYIQSVKVCLIQGLLPLQNDCGKQNYNSTEMVLVANCPLYLSNKAK